MAAQSDQKSLTAAMEARRVALRLHWDEVAARADISVTHLRRIRKAAYLPSPLIQAKLEEALQWAPGSIERILDGGDPVELGEPTSVAVQGTAGRISTHGGMGSVSAEDAEESSVETESEPLTGEAAALAHLQKLLELSKQVDAERLAEQNRLLAEQNRLLAERNRLLEQDERRRKGA